MARGDAGAALIAALVLAACGDRDREHRPPAAKPGAVKKYGTVDPADFAHPAIRRPGAVVIEGCCTIMPGSARVATPEGDAQIFIVEGEGYRAEIRFGFAEGGGDPDGGAVGRRMIHGVVLRQLDDGDGPRRMWSADVPVRPAAAAARGVVNPTLRIDGTCRDDRACGMLDELVGAIRF